MVGNSVISSGREGYNTPSGEFGVIEKNPTYVSSIYGDYVDRSGEVLTENVEVKKIQDRAAQSFGRTNAILSEKSMGVGMHAVICPAIRPHMAVSGSQRKWRPDFFKMFRLERLWRFGKRCRGSMVRIHLFLKDLRR